MGEVKTTGSGLIDKTHMHSCAAGALRVRRNVFLSRSIQIHVFCLLQVQGVFCPSIHPWVSDSDTNPDTSQRSRNSQVIAKVCNLQDLTEVRSSSYQATFMQDVCLILAFADPCTGVNVNQVFFLEHTHFAYDQKQV